MHRMLLPAWPAHRHTPPPASIGSQANTYAPVIPSLLHPIPPTSIIGCYSSFHLSRLQLPCLGREANLGGRD